MAKLKEKEKAIKLRKQGLSYSEILKQVSVSKSTLSLWLRSVGLTERQKQRLTKKKLASMKRGWEAKHQKRVEKEKKIITAAKKEIKSISSKELKLIGITLYWAEGAKANPERGQHSPDVRFINSDPTTITSAFSMDGSHVSLPTAAISTISTSLNPISSTSLRFFMSQRLSSEKGCAAVGTNTSFRSSNGLSATSRKASLSSWVVNPADVRNSFISNPLIIFEELFYFLENLFMTS
jgi:transcriptional regulator with XRE-family HTH domain